jgi:predicted negative regulator of RcsB-dependent stress response
MQKLIHDFPKSEYVRDAHLRIAKTWEDANQPAKAGEAYANFAADYPSDSSAAAASLKAADLYASGGMEAKADTLRLGYVRKNPNDVETAMDVYETLARRDLASVSPKHPISVLLASEREAAAKKTVHHSKSARAVARRRRRRRLPPTSPSTCDARVLIRSSPTTRSSRRSASSRARRRLLRTTRCA